CARPLRGAARLAEARRRGQPDTVEQPRGRRGQGGIASESPAQEIRGRAVEGDRATVEGETPVGGRQAALEAMLAEQYGHPPLLVRPSQERGRARARHRVALRG